MISLFSADRQHLLTESHTSFSLCTQGKKQISGFSFSSYKDTSSVGSGPHFYDFISSIQLLSHVRLISTLQPVAYQAPLSIGFSRQKYWKGLPCPPPGDLPDPETKPVSLSFLHWQASSLPLDHLGNPHLTLITSFTDLITKYNYIGS